MNSKIRPDQSSLESGESTALKDLKLSVSSSDASDVIQEITEEGNAFKKLYMSLYGDICSLCLLLFLYTLQGVPLGITASVPLLLQSKHIEYSSQAIFSFATWPFSCKLLWAPIVDSIYCKRIGRRKSWLVPCQYAMGLFLFGLSHKVNSIMGDNGAGPNVYLLLVIFLGLNFLCATQDIAVDGWALTMLSRKNIGLGPTCNAVGQTIGVFLGYVLFLTLESADFANSYIRSNGEEKPYGLVDLSGYLYFWGAVFITFTTLLAIFKKEVDHSVEKPNETEEKTDHDLGIIQTYNLLWKIVKLKPMMYMVVILLTSMIPFSATGGLTDLKLIDMGMPKDKLAQMNVVLTPLQILLPWIISKWTTGSRPLNIFLCAYPYRIVVCLLYAFLVWWTPSFKKADGSFYPSIYLVWICGSALYEVGSFSMFVANMSFNAQVSDPRIGGTYMTLLNTLGNLGIVWPITSILYVTDWLTFKNCISKDTNLILFSCHKKDIQQQCVAGGNVCELSIDGYYICVAGCTIIGIIWYIIFYKKMKYVQRIPREDWRVIKN